MDIKGNLRGPAGRLSNFTARTFVFDQVPCACIEALLQSFKFDNPELQQEICVLSGRAAKARGQERNEAWQSRQMLWWQGKEYPRIYTGYQLLLDRVYDTVFRMPEFQADLLATGDEVLTHSIGEKDYTKTVLTEDEFCTRLMKLRAQLREQPKHLTLEKMNEAARLIESDGDGAYHIVAKRYGKEVAQLLYIPYLRVRLGSTATWPASPDINAKVIAHLKSL